MRRQFDLIVFDWDGTLLDSTGAIARCIQSAARDLGLAVPDDARARHVIGLGLRDALAYACPDLDPSDHGRMVDRYRHHYLACDADLVLFEGVREMLAELESRTHLLAIATGKSAAGLRRALASSGLGTHFVATRCADQTAPKPDPAMLNELLAELDVPPHRAVMIGDTSHDLQMAHAAGTAAIAVHYGAHPADELARWPTVANATSAIELHRWLTANA